MKKIIITLYSLIIICMGVATIIEKYHGTDFVSAHVYGAWWFTSLWTLLAAAAVAYFIRRRVKRLSTVRLHSAFIIILAGALLTHISARRGMIHLRMNETADRYLVPDGNDGMKEKMLPFSISLRSFKINYHAGTDAVADYESNFMITDGDRKTEGKVSMNNIFSYRGMRFYQSSYDEDGRGSVLAINSDPYGIPVTYAGYALLFASLIWMLFDPKGSYRRILRSLKKAMTDDKSRAAVLPMFIIGGLMPCKSSAATVVPQSEAAKFGTLDILYNARICPVQTFAIDFTKKLYGSAGYGKYTPEQVLTGFIFYGNEWCDEPIIKLKRGALRETLQLPEFVSVNVFFNKDMGGYILGPYIHEYYNGNHDEFHRQAADVDDRIQMIMELRRGSSLKIFPFTAADGTTNWYSPDGSYPKESGVQRVKYIQDVFPLLYQDIMKGDVEHAGGIIGTLAEYQKRNGGQSLPSAFQASAERLYNSVPFATILFMVNLATGFLSLFLYMCGTRRRKRVAENVFFTLSDRIIMPLSWLALTVCLALRWIIGGTVPLSNGYETMLFIAWIIMLTPLFGRRFKTETKNLDGRKSLSLYTYLSALAYMMSGFFLLVAHIGQMNPQISHIMPVLNSPLLCLHVSIIMLAFALLSMTFIISLTTLVSRIRGKKDGKGSSETTGTETKSYCLNLAFLYPALAFLGIGIFTGAVWANVSWGTYWSWDPKEVWALITFMVYAPAVHTASLPAMRRPTFHNIYLISAFLTILMTYFGCNYFLSGMHSYA